MFCRLVRLSAEDAACTVTGSSGWCDGAPTADAAAAVVVVVVGGVVVVVVGVVVVVVMEMMRSEYTKLSTMVDG